MGAMPSSSDPFDDTLVDDREQTNRGFQKEKGGEKAESSSHITDLEEQDALSLEALDVLGLDRIGAADAEKAESALRLLAEESARKGDARKEADALIGLAHVMSVLENRLEESLELAGKAEAALVRAGGDAALEAQLRACRGNSFLSLGRLDDARAEHRRSLEILQEANRGESAEAASVHSNLAFVYWNLDGDRSVLAFGEHSDRGGIVVIA
jgi:hypothetical protein